MHCDAPSGTPASPRDGGHLQSTHHPFWTHLRARRVTRGAPMRLALHGVLASTLLLATCARPGSAASTVATAMIRCCHAVGSGTTMCQAMTGQACQSNGGVGMGPGACDPNPGAGATT